MPHQYYQDCKQIKKEVLSRIVATRVPTREDFDNVSIPVTDRPKPIFSTEHSRHKLLKHYKNSFPETNAALQRYSYETKDAFKSLNHDSSTIQIKIRLINNKKQKHTRFKQAS